MEQFENSVILYGNRTEETTVYDFQLFENSVILYGNRTKKELKYTSVGLRIV